MIKIDFNKVDWDSPIAHEVYPYGREWVIKRVLARYTVDLIRSFEEIVLSFRLKHANILPLKGYFIFSTREHMIYLKYPRMKESLQDYIKKNKFIEVENINQWFYQIICAVEYMHEQGITHRDIKHANILLDSDSQIKLAGLGISTYLGDEVRKMISENDAMKCMAPEVKNDSAKINWFKADVWSLGIVLLELYSTSKKDLNYRSDDI